MFALRNKKNYPVYPLLSGSLTLIQNIIDLDTIKAVYIEALSAVLSYLPLNKSENFDHFEQTYTCIHQ